MVTPLWAPTPEGVADTHLDRFRRFVNTQAGQALASYPELLRWSLDERPAFWSALWDFAGVIGEKGSIVARNPELLRGTEWFPESRLNFSENLLARGDDEVAIIARDESGTDRTLTWRDLHDQSERVAGYFADRGVGAGDRVAGILTNGPEAVVAMLAATRLGAVWASCSPDFGSAAIIDRFVQIQPRLVLGCSEYSYGGKPFDCRAKLAAVAAELPDAHFVDVTESWSQLAQYPRPRAGFERRPFTDPLYIMFSSGTTGVPKCIVHGIGGAILQHRKEHLLHCDVRAGERLFFHTTCGWMMWNWLLGGLSSGATLCLYDGAPTHPGPETLFALADETDVAHFGLSPGLVTALDQAGYQPGRHYRFDALRSILSTGSPLSAEGFQWLSTEVANVRVSSITGGTDILGCFALGNPTQPVYAGEIQSVALGMDIAFVDDNGRPQEHDKGELVCRQSFPSMPIGFWNDPDGSRYRSAYFETFPGCWHHGDFGQFTDHDGVIIHGRSDAVLNRGGVRIGTAELYRHAESVEEVTECVAVAREAGGDVQIVLFVHLTDPALLDADLEARIRRAIRTGASPRHVPDIIRAVADLPRTRSGKLVEVAVREVIHGRPVKNIGALANPEALELFENISFE